jgi:hypothetical protein
MRLSSEKVHDLAARIVAAMAAHPKVHLQASQDALRVLVGSVIQDDLREEAEIEAEADRLLNQYARQIDKGDLDVHTLRNKFKQELARKRGFVL